MFRLKKLHSLVSRYKGELHVVLLLCVCVCLCVQAVVLYLAEKQELVRERNDAVDRLEGYVRDTEARSKE